MAEDDRHWVFGYGSLIYKVDFPFLEREVATLTGWSRRLWQGSHDHRGTPDAPGRVATLIAEATAQCRGIAYLVGERVFEHLDHREKNGYERHNVDLHLDRLGERVAGTLYIAAPGNPAFLGPASTAAIARQVLSSAGPSGSNTDYVLQLAAALRELGDPDEHIMAIERELLAAAHDRHAAS